MDANSQRSNGAGVTSSLKTAIEALNLAKEVSGIAPAKAAFGSVSVLLTMIRHSMMNKTAYVELGLACADVCKALERGMNGKKLDDLNQTVCEAIAQLMRTVVGIQEEVVEKGRRNLLSRLVHAKNDKEMIASWRSELNSVLQVFTTELVMSAHIMVSDLHCNVFTGRERTDGQPPLTQVSIPGESPPPPPRACFGRNELIEKIIGFTESLTPIALIGPGGIGKTSIALTILHHDRIKEQFGENRRFIRCDQFPASGAHLLSRLSKVIGAGVENPENLTPLRPFLSSTKMIVFLDNAESILDPRGTNGRDIYAMVEELTEFRNICLCITSRISTIPPACETLDIPTLTMEAACDTFYRIYKNSGQRELVCNILQQLDFHPLSITLLATVAHHSKWATERLAREWESQRTDVLHTLHETSLAATIELSLGSPMFQALGSNARDLLGVVAFFPQGINESHLDWLFPSNTRNVADNFCVLSLVYRSNGFIMMLAPLRDYLCPKNLASFPLLHSVKKQYLGRLSVHVYPDKSSFNEARWIMSEDVNVEHLLDVFTSIDADSVDIWDACYSFMEHLYWHKPRLVVLGPKIEGLPDDHASKHRCLFRLSRLFDAVGNLIEEKRLLTDILELRRGDFWDAETLRFLGRANRLLGLHEEGISQVKEALEIYERLDNIPGQARSLQRLAQFLRDDSQLDAAQEAASRAINLLPDKGEEFLVCESHRVLGGIYSSKDEIENAIHHFKTALEIASAFNWHNRLFCNHYTLARLFFKQGRFDDAHAHVEHAQSHAVDDPYNLGRTMHLQARLYYEQHRLEEAKSQVLRAANVFEKLGAMKQLGACKELLRDVEGEMKKPVTSAEADVKASHLMLK